MTLDIAAVLNGTLAEPLALEPDGSVTRRALRVADLQRELPDVCVDSRTATPDSLFVALPGERADGHDFVADALRSGATAAIVSRVPDGLGAAGVSAGDGRTRYLFLVPDSLTALHNLATYWRRRHDARIIGITGSIGKTTTKEIVSAVLRTAWPVLSSNANLNTEVGLPLMLLRLRPEHRAAVLEMGMYVKGDISLLARIAEPHIGVVTSIAPVHLERMGSIEAIAREKSRLVAALPSNGLAVLNADDPWTRAMAEVSGVAPSVLVGLAEDATYRAENVTARGLEGTAFTLRAEQRRMDIETAVAGTHTVHAFLAAAAIARSMGLELDDIAASMREVRLDLRQRIIRHRADMLIIDDSYNAAPMSMNAALALLDASPGTKIAVLGDMLELGSLEESAHREVGERAAQVADWLVVRGPRSVWMAEAAERGGLPSGRVVRAATNAEALAAVREIVSMESAHGGGVAWAILVKGSRGMEMEEVVAGLRGEG